MIIEVNITDKMKEVLDTQIEYYYQKRGIRYTRGQILQANAMKWIETNRKNRGLNPIGFTGDDNKEEGK